MLEPIITPLKSYIFQNIYGNEYAFRMTFQPGSIPAGLVTTIAGTRWDEVNGVPTSFGINVPRITERGLGACSAYTVYKNDTASSNLTLAAAGTYTLWVRGSGSAVLSGASTGNGTAVEGTPLTFTTASAGMTVSIAVGGELERLQVNSGACKFPFIPPESGTLPRASVNEFGGYSFTAGVNTKLLSYLNREAGQISMTVTAHCYPATGGMTIFGPIKGQRNGLIEAVTADSCAAGSWLPPGDETVFDLVYNGAEFGFSSEFVSRYSGTMGLTNCPILSGALASPANISIKNIEVYLRAKAPLPADVGCYATFKGSEAATETIDFDGGPYSVNDTAIASGASYTATTTNKKLKIIPPATTTNINLFATDIALTTGQLSAWSPTGAVYLGGTGVTGDIGQLSEWRPTSNVSFSTTDITGDIGQLSAWRPTGAVNFSTTDITGDIGQLSAWRPTGSVSFYATDITGDIGQLSEWRPTGSVSFSVTDITGDIGQLSEWRPTGSVSFSVTDITGDIGQLSAWRPTSDVGFGNTGITGDIGQLSAWRPTGSVNFGATGISACTSQNMFPTSKALRFDSCKLNQLAVDNLLISAVNGGQTGGSIQLQGGTNAAPSSAGLAAKTTLLTRGWTVTHN